MTNPVVVTVDDVVLTIHVTKKGKPLPVDAANPVLTNILGIVAAYFKMEKEMLSSGSRIKTVALARHITIYLCREHNVPMVDIMNSLRIRSHGTVLYACETIQRQIETDTDFSEDIEYLKERIDNHVQNKQTKRSAKSPARRGGGGSNPEADERPEASGGSIEPDGSPLLG
jgi:hypothetical protein